MSRLARIWLVGLLTFAVVLTTFARPVAAAPKSGDTIPGHYIITLKDGVDVDALLSRISKTNSLSVLHTYKFAMKGFAATIPANKLAVLRAMPEIVSIEQDQVVTLADQATTEEIGILAQTLPIGVNRVDGDLSSSISGNGNGSVNVDVAVIGTGIQTNHPDLNVVGGKNCNDGTSYNDGNGSSTHVAGTIAAKDDANGVVGVAPGARLWAVRVLSNAGSGTISQVICGIDWITANAGTIEVAHVSFGSAGPDSTCTAESLHNAICNSVNAGVTYVVGAGGSGSNASNFRPATYPEVITVSALADFDGQPGGVSASTCVSDVDDTFLNSSNYGADIDLIAPGTCVYSTWIGSSYRTLSGSSTASPHVAGAAALYTSINPAATPAQVRTALQNAGNLNWNNSDDPDGIKEKLVNVDAF